MNKSSILVTTIVLFGLLPLLSCSKSQLAIPTNDEAVTIETGTLQLRANGEDFVRQGFISKDGWQILFDRIYVNLAEVNAYQTDPPYDPHEGGNPQAKQSVTLVSSKTIDLAAGDENADPILVGEMPAPSGRYNALSWTLNSATSGPAKGYSLVLIGQAKKASETIDFTLKMDRKLAFVCGEFVGESRKGILEPGGTAELEATFHFDHLFGDGNIPANDEMNTDALGFSPLADLARDRQVEEDLTGLETKLSPENYQKLLQILPSLGHVGEGHCHESITNHSTNL